MWNQKKPYRVSPDIKVSLSFSYTFTWLLLLYFIHFARFLELDVWNSRTFFVRFAAVTFVSFRFQFWVFFLFFVSSFLRFCFIASVSSALVLSIRLLILAPPQIMLLHLSWIISRTTSNSYVWLFQQQCFSLSFDKHDRTNWHMHGKSNVWQTIHFSNRQLHHSWWKKRLEVWMEHWIFYTIQKL